MLRDVNQWSIEKDLRRNTLSGGIGKVCLTVDTLRYTGLQGGGKYHHTVPSWNVYLNQA